MLWQISSGHHRRWVWFNWNRVWWGLIRMLAILYLHTQGVICEENCRGMSGFIIHHVTLHTTPFTEGEATSHMVFYACMLTAEPWLLEPVYVYEIQMGSQGDFDLFRTPPLGVQSISSSLAPSRYCFHGYKTVQRSEGRHPISGELPGQAVNGGCS